MVKDKKNKVTVPDTGALTANLSVDSVVNFFKESKLN
jgi:hypothetical protein